MQFHSVSFRYRSLRLSVTEIRICNAEWIEPIIVILVHTLTECSDPL